MDSHKIVQFSLLSVPFGGLIGGSYLITSSLMRDSQRIIEEQKHLSNIISRDKVRRINPPQMTAQYVYAFEGDTKEKWNEPICEEWFRGKDKPQPLKQEECNALANSRFGKEKNKKESVWINILKDEIKRILEKYQLFDQSSLSEGTREWTKDSFKCVKKDLTKNKLQAIIDCEYLSNKVEEPKEK